MFKFIVKKLPFIASTYVEKILPSGFFICTQSLPVTVGVFKPIIGGVVKVNILPFISIISASIEKFCTLEAVNIVQFSKVPFNIGVEPISSSCSGKNPASVSSFNLTGIKSLAS